MPWTWWKKETFPEAIEKALTDLLAKIHRQEAKSLEFRHLRRRNQGLFTLYGVILYFVYLAIWFLLWAGRSRDQGLRPWLIGAAPLVWIPLLVYFVRKLLGIYYGRRIQYHESQLETLRLQQREKVEELKTKTQFYSTQLLLDRFDHDKAPSSPISTPEAGLRQRTRGEALSPLICTSPSLSHKFQRSSAVQNTSKETPEDQKFETRLKLSDSTANLKPSDHLLSTSTPMHFFSDKPRQRTVVDRVLDLILGEDETAPSHRYALICHACRAHNGLAPAGTAESELKKLGYQCPKCGYMNVTPTEKDAAAKPAEDSIKSDDAKSAGE